MHIEKECVLVQATGRLIPVCDPLGGTSYIINFLPSASIQSSRTRADHIGRERPHDGLTALYKSRGRDLKEIGLKCSAARAYIFQEEPENQSRPHRALPPLDNTCLETRDPARKAPH